MSRLLGFIGKLKASGEPFAKYERCNAQVLNKVEE